MTSSANKGDVFILIDPLSGQGAALSAYLETIRTTPPAEGFDKVLIPGERGPGAQAGAAQSRPAAGR